MGEIKSIRKLGSKKAKQNHPEAMLINKIPKKRTNWWKTYLSIEKASEGRVTQRGKMEKTYLVSMSRRATYQQI